jgi:hypothetical protein
VADLERGLAGEQHRILGVTLMATVCFAVWTIFLMNRVQINKPGLSDTAFGLLIAIPILTGSLSRIFLGIWTDGRPCRSCRKWPGSIPTSGSRQPGVGRQPASWRADDLVAVMPRARRRAPVAISGCGRAPQTLETDPKMQGEL